ncbi:MAG: phage tail sheath C-terminal domain-containing protein, partial [Oscillospiraceae bacterium]
AFLGKPLKIIVIKIATTEKFYTAALQMLSTLRWNYLAVPEIAENETAVISAWIKEQRDVSKKLYKAVLPKTAADHEGVINFSTDNIKTTLSSTSISCGEYCARIAGLLAGLAATKSCTYYQLSEIVSCDGDINPSEQVAAGKLIILFDGEIFKIGRGINSLVTLSATKTADFAKIKVVEGHDQYADDIRWIFEDKYIGKMPNNYDNKLLLVAAIDAYQKELISTVLSSEFNNTVQLDLPATRKYLEDQGTQTIAMSDSDILKSDTGSNVFISSHIKFVDAIEDMVLTAYLE